MSELNWTKLNITEIERLGEKLSSFLTVGKTQFRLGLSWEKARDLFTGFKDIAEMEKEPYQTFRCLISIKEESLQLNVASWNFEKP